MLTIKEAFGCLPAVDLSEDAEAAILLPRSKTEHFEPKAYVAALLAARIVAEGDTELLRTLMARGVIDWQGLGQEESFVLQAY